MTCGIYMIQNKINGKLYIGQAVDIERRWVDHKRKLGKGCHGNKHLQTAWNKYGEDNFDFGVICKCDESQLNTMEQYYIFELMTYDREMGYNGNYGGKSGRLTKETRKKISEAGKGENHPNFGKHLYEETKKKIGEANKGRTMSEYTKRKLLEANRGKHLSEEHRRKLSESLKGEKNHMYGKHHSEETKKKISEFNKGKHHSEETKKKISKNSSKYWKGKIGAENPNSIPVVQLTLDGKLVNVYGSAGEVKRDGFSHCHVNECTNGKRKTHKGYKWMFLSDYEKLER